ncbi:2-dehydro-3-deoxyphosphogluconate aldolase / (4S)-4-hydroxy-2-oxoglutarate aldolase [Micromonospora viridifaciens]|uniref:2-dehydro-3-deoxyphosphogluconate aldolase / (4S)-4-hydroxy-2-oxoglutarate aldolase n=1 Tax=Micromonospora viridifaciens TaxID=1881 RepID=A0A1C4WSQ6_MICVI|nr:bifunctional 4-hydroxy-2-oxoglutarate aldolase/2-dehydro-3-deoxy-phosphogluconate aldolase [Micromonospora viridifaciens]SCE99265.1 2-dehydro-3-deoxyphosphogluconate aldolase / (4S)-4-hydroxy-2-oxoglutarate aldolase [Micromonospora viridifaciens]
MTQTSVSLGLPIPMVETGVIAILRPAVLDHLDATVSALVGAGVRCLEVTATTPNFLAVLRRMVDEVPDGVTVGLGTVTDLSLAERAIAAGASFIVTPGVVDGLPDVAHRHGVPCIVGAWSPTEVMRAVAAGADAVKIFPAATGGVAHLRSLREPFPAVPFVPSGGLTCESAVGFVSAGAVAVGLGGALTGSALRDGRTTAIDERVPALLASVAAARGVR